jgi:acyl-lipid omega-6 desaturase (Delta-12 desaturase)
MRPRQRRSVIITNLALALVLGAICWLVGWQAWLLVQMPSAILAGTAGVWLFYVQHQFEDVYWESGDSWGYADAALRRSSHLKLPHPLQFFTGNNRPPPRPPLERQGSRTTTCSARMTSVRSSETSQC